MTNETWPRPNEDASDLAVIDSNADELNAEAQDALAYQVPPLDRPSPATP